MRASLDVCAVRVARVGVQFWVIDNFLKSTDFGHLSWCPCLPDNDEE